MDRDQAREYVRGQLEDYLRSRGVNDRKTFTCMNPEHEDRHPSMSYDRKRNKVHCFGCSADYDTFDLIGIEYGLTAPADIFNKAYELYGLDIGSARPEKVTRPLLAINTQPTQQTQPVHDTQEERAAIAEYLDKARQLVGQTDYFQRRGLSLANIERYGLGYDPAFRTREGDDFKTWAAVVIPTGPNSFTVRNTDDQAEKANRIRKRGPSCLYNTGALSGTDPVFVVEGELDALSLIEVGAAAMALGSTANADQFIRTVKNQAPAAPLILALDNDVDGQQTTGRIRAALSDLGISFLEANVSREYKDPNEALVQDRVTFSLAVLEAQETAAGMGQAEEDSERTEYLKNNVANHIDAFVNGIADSVNTPSIPTGFAKLDLTLDGGLYEGLYIIGAISSLGKTTFILQLSDQLAGAQQDVLIFSLEQARSELMAKSISRLTMVKSGDPRNAKTARGITTGKRYQNYSQTEKDLIREAVDLYSGYACRLFISEGAGDIGAATIRETVARHVSLTGRRPVVVVDYLQLLAPHDPRATDKQATDKSVLELKRISRDYKIPVLAISSFNRMNYGAAVMMEAFKESGAIEYSSDVLIGLQAKGAGKKDFDVNAAKRKDPREVELVVLKNRNGRTGDTVSYKYYPMFNLFREE